MFDVHDGVAFNLLTCFLTTMQDVQTTQLSGTEAALNGTDALTTLPEILTSETTNGIGHPAGLADSPDTASAEDETKAASLKKKKKKKAKKNGKASGDGQGGGATNSSGKDEELRPPVLCISRNKHWKYISSYHVSGIQI